MKHKLLAITALAFLCCLGSSAGAADTKPLAKHIVLISLDGWAARGMDAADMPNVRALMEEGSWTLHKRSVWPTSSSKNWPSMFNGMGPELHGFLDEEQEGPYGSLAMIHGFPPRVLNKNGVLPTIFNLYREKYPDAEIGGFYQWTEIPRFADQSVFNVMQGCDEDGMAVDLCADAAKYIMEKKPDLLMVGLNHPDHEGHTFGWYTRDYYDALRIMDSNIGVIVSALKKAGLWKDSIVLLSADHGGTGRAHSGSTIMEYETPFVICGKGIRKGHEIQSPMMQYDVAATMAVAAGLTAPQAWEGKPVREVFKDKKLREPKAAPLPRRAGHVVVIGLDGWSSHGMDVADMPNVKKLIAGGASTMYKTSVIPTLSTENWASMFNGVPPEMHGFYSEIGNDWRAPLVEPALRNEKGLFPTVFSVIREKYPDMEMGAIHQWSGISNLIDKEVFNHYAHLGAEKISADAAAYIKEKKPELLLLAWDEPDATGHHNHKWFGKEYFAALHRIDGYIGEVVEALDEAGILDDTIILLTADHGGVRDCHGGTADTELYTPFAVWGKGVRKGHVLESSVVQFDVAATIAAALGIAPAPYWYGKPINEVYE